MAWMAPILLVQVGVIQPVCLAVLDMEKARKGQGTLSVTKYLTLPIRNPITVGIVLGLIVNITGTRLRLSSPRRSGWSGTWQSR